MKLDLGSTPLAKCMAMRAHGYGDPPAHSEFFDRLLLHTAAPYVAGHGRFPPCDRIIPGASELLSTPPSLRRRLLRCAAGQSRSDARENMLQRLCSRGSAAGLSLRRPGLVDAT